METTNETLGIVVVIASLLIALALFAYMLRSLGNIPPKPSLKDIKSKAECMSDEELGKFVRSVL